MTLSALDSAGWRLVRMEILLEILLESIALQDRYAIDIKPFGCHNQFIRGPILGRASAMQREC